MNTTILGDERERELLGYIRQTRMSAELPDVRDPDRHIDAEDKQLKVNNLKFDDAWIPERVLLELDSGQWMPGGGRHNSDADRWKTLEAQAFGWTVLHISYTMLKQNPVRVMRVLAAVLDGRVNKGER